MKISPEELPANQYELLDTLDHALLAPFIRKYLKKPSFTSLFYYAANLALFGLAVYLFTWGYGADRPAAVDRFAHFSYGIALAFTLVPIHEYIHVLAYRSQGAVQTSYAMNLRKFYFMALADRFVANRKEFTVIAMAPFVSISLVLAVAYYFIDPKWRMIITGILFAHTAMCSGDFGLLNYFSFHKNRELVTYDDVPNKISYFFAKKYPSDRLEKMTDPR